MATALTTYQRLAMGEQTALRIRKYAARRLLALEQGLDGLESQRQTVEGAMRHEPSGDGRGTAQAPMGAVAVTATTVRASDRQRIRDGHDARPADERSGWRNVTAANPYGDDWRLRDDLRMGEGLSPAERCSDVVTYRVPSWVPREELSTAALHRIAAAGFGIHHHSKPVTERDLRPARKTFRETITASVQRHQRQTAARAAAGTIRMGEQD